MCALQLPLLASPDYDPAVGRSGDLHHVQETLRQVAATLRSPTEWWLGAAANNACRTSLPGRQVQGMSAWTYAHLSVHQHHTVTKQPSGSSQPEPGTVHPPWLLGELAPGGQVWKDGNAPELGDSGQCATGLLRRASGPGLMGAGAEMAPFREGSPSTRAKRPLRSMLSSVLLPTFSSCSRERRYGAMLGLQLMRCPAKLPSKCVRLHAQWAPSAVRP